MRRPTPRFSPPKGEFIIADGGLDLVTPPFQLKPGRVRAALNFECGIEGGYRRIDGYERFSGKPKPSEAHYAVLAANITGAYAVGNTLTGATSGATGQIIAATGSAFILTKVVGAYVSGENLTIGGTVRGVSTAASVVDGGSTPLLHAQYKNLAADVYRADIAAVPGSGDVLGVWLYSDVVYAFRNNAGATAAEMYKSTAGGWVKVDLGFEQSFTGGVAAIADGQTVTGATSGATGVVSRVVLQSGAWSGTAAGRLIFASITGTFQNAENLQVGGITKAVASGTQSAITQQPGGRYEFINKNFGGAANAKRMYGVDRVSRGFEFDGTTFVPIVTGNSPDTPTHLCEHKQMLVYAFGGSIQHAGIGTPYMWTLLAGAAELAAGDTITGFKPQAGSNDTAALAVLTRNRMLMLYGTGPSTWNLVGYGEEQGGYAHTVQQIGQTIMMDDRGLTTLQTSSAFGNFKHATISMPVQPWLNTRRIRSTASALCAEKSQYRIFFSDNYALYVTFNGQKLRGMMPQLYAHTVKCACSGEMNDGSEAMFFGSTDGYVFQNDVGTSFDGEPIEFYLDFAFNWARAVRIIKKFLRAVFETQGEGYSQYSASADIAYGSTEFGQPTATAVESAFSIATWDTFTWDQFTWDGQSIIPSEVPLEGAEENISIKVYGMSDYYSPITFSGIFFSYQMLRSKP